MSLLNFDVPRDEGIVAIDGADEMQLRKVRLINLIEPIILYAVIIYVMWATMLEESLALYLAYSLLLIWVLILGPWFHFQVLKEGELFLSEENRKFSYWFWECRGIGSFVRYYRGRDGEQPWIKQYWKEILYLLLFFNILFLGAAVEFQSDVTEYFIEYGVPTTAIVKVLVITGLLLLIDGLLVLIGFPIMIRFDNLNSGLPDLKFMTIVGVIMVVLANILFFVFWESLIAQFGWNESASFSLKGDLPEVRMHNLTIVGILGQWTGYVFWGWLQQLLFLSIFSTQFARAFPIEKDKKYRIYVAALTSIFFGIIHLMNFWLSCLTVIAGFIWALAFMKNRNLFIMGASHGFLGTLSCKLLPISFNVGPNAV